MHTGIAPDIMALAKALGGGFPIGACLATAEAGKGMTAGTHGSTFGGNPLATSVGNAVLDVVLAPGFLEHTPQDGAAAEAAARRTQGPLSVRDRATCAARGCCSGCVCVVPNTEMVAALRTEKMLAVAAGDNVVRLLPPLIIDEAGIADGIAMIERACEPLSHAAKPVEPGGSLMAKHSIRHFIDLIDIPPADLRAIIAAARAMKKGAGAAASIRSPARRWR